MMKLHIPIELHAARPMGNRLRHRGSTDSTDDPAKQVTVSSAHRRTQGTLVSEHTRTHARRLLTLFLFSFVCSHTSCMYVCVRLCVDTRVFKSFRLRLPLSDETPLYTAVCVCMRVCLRACVLVCACVCVITSLCVNDSRAIFEIGVQIAAHSRGGVHARFSSLRSIIALGNYSTVN